MGYVLAAVDLIQPKLHLLPEPLLMVKAPG